jgi:hypothetical protein
VLIPRAITIPLAQSITPVSFFSKNPFNSAQNPEEKASAVNTIAKQNMVFQRFIFANPDGSGQSLRIAAK